MTKKKKKYLILDPTEHVQDFYAENYKMLMGEIKEDIRKWRDVLCSWIRRFNIGKINSSPTDIQV